LLATVALSEFSIELCAWLRAFSLNLNQNQNQKKPNEIRSQDIANKPQTTSDKQTHTHRRTHMDRPPTRGENLLMMLTALPFAPLAMLMLLLLCCYANACKKPIKMAAQLSAQPPSPFPVWSGKLNAIYLHFRFILSALNAPNNNQGKCDGNSRHGRHIESLNEYPYKCANRIPKM